jgi:hypothetical protein
MTTEVLGNLSFLETPTVNGASVLLNAGGVPSILSDSTANRPVAGTAGRLFVDTTTNVLQRDTGSAWVNVGSSTTYTGTTDQIAVTGTVISLAPNPIIPGTESLTLPVGTTAQRPALPIPGDIRYNSTLGLCEKYTGAYWGPFGLLLQQTTVAVAAQTGTTTVPLDNTTPLSTEGWQFFSQTFTPLSATSRIVIRLIITTASSAAGTIIGSIFAGTTNLGSAAVVRQANNSAHQLGWTIVHQPGSTAAITYTGRIGNSAAATTYVNNAGGSTLGGSLVSFLTIEEVE